MGAIDSSNSFCKIQFFEKKKDNQHQGVARIASARGLKV
jgi:hypothetical protein